MAVLDAGAEEVEDLGESWRILSEPQDVVAVRTALQDAGLDYESAEVQFEPTMSVTVDKEGAQKVMKVVDALEDCDDVQNVFSNVDIPESVMAELDPDD